MSWYLPGTAGMVFSPKVFICTVVCICFACGSFFPFTSTLGGSLLSLWPGAWRSFRSSCFPNRQFSNPFVALGPLLGNANVGDHNCGHTGTEHTLRSEIWIPLHTNQRYYNLVPRTYECLDIYPAYMRPVLCNMVRLLRQTSLLRLQMFKGAVCNVLTTKA